MSKNDQSIELGRRTFLSLGVATGAAVLGSASLEAEAQQAGPAKGSTPGTILAKPLPQKVYQTEAHGISRKTHDTHYTLYQGYVNKVNEIRDRLSKLGVPDPTKANQIYSEMRALKVDYTFALGGLKNHELYFANMGGQGGNPTGAVANIINQSFGSYENWKADFKATGIAARGWVWLAHDYTDNSFFNYIGDAQNTFPMWNATPILALDVYEHAYFMDFGSKRGDYIEAFLKVIDWDNVNANLKMAVEIAKASRNS